MYFPSFQVGELILLAQIIGFLVSAIVFNILLAVMIFRLQDMQAMSVIMAKLAKPPDEFTRG